MTEHVTVYITVESEDVAVHIATELVKQRLVACANIKPGMRSIYEWHNMIQFDAEVAVDLKTTSDKVEGVIERVKKMHSYDVPCIVVHPIINGNPEYLQWITTQVTEEPL